MGKEASIIHSPSPRTWARFTAAFDDDRESFESPITVRSCELPSYDSVSHEQMRSQVARGLAGFRSVLADRRLLTPDELRLYWSVTKTQADLGVTMQDTLSSWHIGLDALCNWARNQVALELQPREVLVDFLDLSVAWWRQGSDAAVDYYRQIEKFTGTRELAVDELFWDICSGRFVSKELEDRFLLLGLDPAARYHAMRMRPTNSEDTHEFRGWIGVDADPTAGAAATVGGQVWALVHELPTGGFPLAVGCAPLASSHELSRSFQQAGRALSAATTLGVTGCHGLDSLGVQSAVMLDHALGGALVTRYVEPLVALGASGLDVLATVQAYIANHGNFDLAGAELFVHPNTVRYRIRRFEKEIGASLRDTSTFVAVWWAIERYRMQCDSATPNDSRRDPAGPGSLHLR